MKLSLKIPVLLGGTVFLACLSNLYSAAFAQQQGHYFTDQYKNVPGYPDADHRFVVLNSGIASMVQQHFAMPKDTFTYGLAGMTVFPYYQASPQLKEFLNNANINGMPLVNYPTQTNMPSISLPATDLIRMSVPIPNRNLDQKNAIKFAIRDKRAKDEIPWMVAHQGGQAFAMPGDPDAIVLVSSSTMFGASLQRTMLLRCGMMWVFTGARPAAILTKHGAVCVKPYSIAAVEQTWFNNVRVACLYGQPLEIQLNSQQKTSKVTIEKGKEIAIAGAAVAAKGTSDFVAQNSADGANKNAELTKASEELPDLKLSVKDVDSSSCDLLSELKAVTPPFSSLKISSGFERMFKDYGITPADRREELQKQNLQKYNLASKPAVQKAAIEARYYVPSTPGSEGEPVKFPNASEQLKTDKLRNGLVKCLSNVELKTDERGKTVITEGEGVFVAEQPLQIASGDSQIFLRKGAIVHVKADKNVVALKNLAEAEVGSVKLRLKNRIFECEIGSELIVGPTAPQVFAEMKRDGVGRRNVHTIEVEGGNLFVNKSEIDLASLMQYSPLMRKLYKSPAASDRLLVSDLMKSTVAVNMITQGRGNYRRMSGLPSSTH
jgi:hypothetical protein